MDEMRQVMKVSYDISIEVYISNQTGLLFARDNQ